MRFDPALEARAKKLVERYTAAGLSIATAESCTGGLVAGLITEIAGSSAVLERGFVVYSNAAKMGMLGVAPETIDANGAVSEPTAREMASGALEHSRADVSVSITGVAGPGGGTATKPVGPVHFACARRDAPIVHVERRFGDIGRAAVRKASVEQALDLLEKAVQSRP